MLAFEARMKIQEELGIKFNVNSSQCKTYLAEVAGMIMTVYIPIRCNIKEGQCIESTKVFVTSKKNSTIDGDLALYVKDTKVLEEELYTPLSNLEVYINGRHVKTDKASIRMIGKNRSKRFLATTFIVSDDSYNPLSLLLLSFNSKAEKLLAVPSNTWLDIECRVHKRRDDIGFELNLTSFTITNRKGVN